jgi:hypothetical protein
MRSYQRWAACAAVIGLGVILSTSQADDDDKKVRDKVEELAGVASKKPDDLQKKAEAWVKEAKPDLDDVMGLLKKRMKDGTGGFGIGKTATGKMDDGIEARIEKLAKAGLDEADLKNKADLIQALNRTKAIAAIAQATKTNKMGAKKWQEYADRMDKGTDDLAKAIESGKVGEVKKAAKNLQSSCVDCHAEFR